MSFSEVELKVNRVPEQEVPESASEGVEEFDLSKGGDRTFHGSKKSRNSPTKSTATSEEHAPLAAATALLPDVDALPLQVGKTEGCESPSPDS